MLGELRNSLRTQGFAVDWMLSRNGDNYMTEYLNKSYLIRQDECIKAEAIISNEQQSLTLARIGYLPIFVVWQCHILVCFQT